MLVASMAAPTQKAAPQAGAGGGEPAASGGSHSNDQPSFDTVLAHEEHTSAAPAPTASATPTTAQAAKPDEAKKPADGVARAVPGPAALLAALLAAVAQPTASPPTVIPPAGSPDGGSAAHGVAKPEKPGLAGGAVLPLLAGALDALVSGRPDRSDRSDRTDPTDRSGQLAAPLDAPVGGGSAKSAPPVGVPALAAASSGSVLASQVAAPPSQAAASGVATADPSPRGKVSALAPAIAAGTDSRHAGNQIVSQGSETLPQIGLDATPRTAKGVEAALHALLAAGTDKTAREGRNSGDTVKTTGDAGPITGAGIAVTGPLAKHEDAGARTPALNRAPSQPEAAPLTAAPLTNLDAASLARSAVAAGLAATASPADQGAGRRIPRVNDDNHAGPAPLVGAAVVESAVRGDTQPGEAAAHRTSQPEAPRLGAANGGDPSAEVARRTSQSESARAIIQPQSTHASEARIATSASPTPAPFTLAWSVQSRPHTAETHPIPVEPGRVVPNPTVAAQDHRSAATGSHRESEGSTVQSWVNGASAAPATQSAAGAPPTAASQTGAVYQPIAQGVLVRQASLQVVGAAASFKVVLHPRSLGEVTVHVTRVQEGLQVTITPQQLSTQTLLNKHLPDLLGTLRTGQDLAVQAQVVAPHGTAPVPLGTPDAAAAGQSGLNFSANGSGQPFTGGQGGGEQQAWAGTVNALLREPVRILGPDRPAVGATTTRLVGNPRIDVQA